MLQDVDKFKVEMLPGKLALCLPGQVSTGESGTFNPTNLLDACGAPRKSVTLLLSLGTGPEIHNERQPEKLYLSTLVQLRPTPITIHQP